MKPLAAILVSLALVAAGCGEDENDEPDRPAQTQTQTTAPDTATGPETPDAPASPAEDEAAVQDVVKKWLIEGGCERMTDKFLEDQLLGLGDDRNERCDLFQKQHQKPQYSEDQIQITEVKVTGSKASLVVGSANAPDIKSVYQLVKTGDQWQIDSAEIQ